MGNPTGIVSQASALSSPVVSILARLMVRSTRTRGGGTAPWRDDPTASERGIRFRPSRAVTTTHTVPAITTTPSGIVLSRHGGHASEPVWFTVKRSGRSV